MSLAIFLKNNIVIQTVHTVGLTEIWLIYAMSLLKTRAINTHVFYTAPNPFDSRFVRFKTRQICRVEHGQEAFLWKITSSRVADLSLPIVNMKLQIG